VGYLLVTTAMCWSTRYLTELDKPVGGRQGQPGTDAISVAIRSFGANREPMVGVPLSKAVIMEQEQRSAKVSHENIDESILVKVCY
jgi:hypothetical protein